MWRVVGESCFREEECAIDESKEEVSLRFPRTLFFQITSNQPLICFAAFFFCRFDQRAENRDDFGSSSSTERSGCHCTAMTK